jgi:hypothetical protein
VSSPGTSRRLLPRWSPLSPTLTAAPLRSTQGATGPAKHPVGGGCSSRERGTAQRLLRFSILFRLGTVRLMFVTPVGLRTLNHLARSALHRPW